MGLRGPRPLTREELERRGSSRAKLRGPTLSAPPGLPKMPPEIRADRRAARKWRQTLYQLSRIGTAYATDGDVLAIYCATWARWAAMQEKPLEDRPGDAMRKEEAALLKLAGVLGLHAQARANLPARAPKPTEEDEIEREYFRGAGT